MKLTDRFASQAVNTILGFKPLAKFAKTKARNMIIDRAEAIGVPWRSAVSSLKSRGSNLEFNPQWEKDLQQITNPTLQYPEYYLTSFHAYDCGNMGWEPATEVEVAAYSVHARIFDSTGKDGDRLLRQSYHNLLKEHIPTPPSTIVDLGCSVGMSTFALQETYPQAHITGVDLSPYFLSVANYRSTEYNTTNKIDWRHAAAEHTGLPEDSTDLVSIFLMCHELPQTATRKIFQEAKRLLKSGGYLAIMDMNPASEVYSKMPPYILTLLKSTEPYLDEYFTLDIKTELVDAGFQEPVIIANSPRHRTIIAQV
jgi:ubiquinone/menaquinone biosynthesis C-methylase UbiE